ncbi:hypothetical protein KCM76_25145 [Zooshikella marina]|uniref:hypothetical protein n=1 Tax=Zooshikella ganghwensis TaxID=202772 RepID=UPI001BAF27AA|nr:hypothetical protein [Zooshikella ganghwensis]MBU2709306.1 hypothetical protein [Zooshikella ganghwensis]
MKVKSKIMIKCLNVIFLSALLSTVLITGLSAKDELNVDDLVGIALAMDKGMQNKDIDVVMALFTSDFVAYELINEKLVKVINSYDEMKEVIANLANTENYHSVRDVESTQLSEDKREGIIYSIVEENFEDHSAVTSGKTKEILYIKLVDGRPRIFKIISSTLSFSEKKKI